MPQEEKQFLNLCGEFLVAGELNRRKVACSVTYGFSKKADVIAFSESGKCVLRIEVKTTNRPEFIVGAKALDVSHVSEEMFWVLVHVPIDDQTPPRYFVLRSAEMQRRASAHFQRKRHAKHHLTRVTSEMA